MNNTKNPRNEAKRGKTNHSIAFVILALFAIWLTIFIVKSPNVYAITEETEVETVDIEQIMSGISPEMDISKPSGISKDDFVFALKNCKYDRNGILADNAEYIWVKCQRYKLHEFAICGVIALESGWVTSDIALDRYNIMSIRNSDGYKYYSSYEECIEDGIKLLSNKYISPDGEYYTGGILKDIGFTYAGDEFAEDWADSISECAVMCAEPLIEE